MNLGSIYMKLKRKRKRKGKTRACGVVGAKKRPRVFWGSAQKT